jgi:hypothetical protein
MASTYRSHHQPDLFQPTRSPYNGGYAALLREPPPADFIERIRRELNDTLAMARDAAALPWRDLTAATLAELRFHSVAGWLPDDEAKALRVCFQHEMRRLYHIAERGAEA